MKTHGRHDKREIGKNHFLCQEKLKTHLLFTVLKGLKIMTQRSNQKPIYILTGLLTVCILKEFIRTGRKPTAALFIMGVMMDMEAERRLRSRYLLPEQKAGQSTPDA